MRIYPINPIDAGIIPDYLGCEATKRRHLTMKLQEARAITSRLGYTLTKLDSEYRLPSPVWTTPDRILGGA